METLSSTEGENLALREEARENPRWGAILDAWFACKADEDDFDFRREDRHTKRRQAGQRLSRLRIAR